MRGLAADGANVAFVPVGATNATSVLALHTRLDALAGGMAG